MRRTLGPRISHFFLILLLLQNDYFQLGFSLSPTVVTMLTITVGIIIAILGRSKTEKGESETIATTYTSLRTGFLIMIVANILSLLTFGIGYYIFQDNLQEYGGTLLLATYAVPLLFVLITMFIRRKEPYSIFYILRHFSKQAWIMLGIGALLVILLYTYAQCQAYFMA